MATDPSSLTSAQIMFCISSDENIADELSWSSISQCKSVSIDENDEQQVKTEIAESEAHSPTSLPTHKSKGKQIPKSKPKKDPAKPIAKSKKKQFEMKIPPIASSVPKQKMPPKQFRKIQRRKSKRDRSKSLMNPRRNKNDAKRTLWKFKGSTADQ
eukprot:13438_1